VQAELTSLKESLAALRAAEAANEALLATYAKDSALTVTQKGLQMDNRELSARVSDLEKELRRRDGRARGLGDGEISEAERKIAQLQALVKNKEETVEMVKASRHRVEVELDDNIRKVYDLKMENERMKQSVGRHSAQEELAMRSSMYAALHDMAQCMDTMLGGPSPSFKQKVHVLVRKCVESSGFSVREVAECEAEVFGLLNRVYMTACAKSEGNLPCSGFPSWHHAAPPPSPPITSRPRPAEEPERRRVKRKVDAPRRTFTNDGGRPAW
jgi:hypothetical protein